MPRTGACFCDCAPRPKKSGADLAKLEVKFLKHDFKFLKLEVKFLGLEVKFSELEVKI